MSDVKITKFHWVRHAPVKAMMPGRIYGQRDVDCNLKDTQAIKNAAQHLPQEAIWVTSRLSRTKKTAQALAKELEIPIKPLAYKELMEQNFGLWQSKTWNDLEDDPQATAFWVDPAQYCPPDGESFADLCIRVQKTITHLARKYSGEEIIVVAHAGTIRAAVAQALELTPDKALRLHVDTLSVTKIDHIDDPARGITYSLSGLNLK